MPSFAEEQSRRFYLRDSINSLREALGDYGALCYAHKRLPDEPDPEIVRKMIAVIRDTSRRVELRLRNARRLARYHAIGLKARGKPAKKSTTRRRPVY